MQYIIFTEGRKLTVFRKSCLGSVYVWEFHFSIKILALIEREAILLCLYIIKLGKFNKGAVLTLQC